ncbi:cellulose biosynthesis protein BcsG [Vibrio methylphosphonaticus]|uniref:cellulose biosynthesis protein BcsG n=1 Tax=Vibrio methylphosphonaticus TaxID=2946866 RepID=UPI00202A2175|nr:cellulose biosynthesis protein BcsG [Vibrio methylphosphonaticus]MCL9773974.1 cellulose biosynthesis protein BcsG [Vibrio methylphosphonaticus]
MNTTSRTYSWFLGWWTVYFALKVFLFWNDTLKFDALYNFALLAFVTFPIPNRWLNRTRHLMAIIFALLLLHHDSFLPPLERLTSQWDLIRQFDSTYLLSLAIDFVSFDLVVLISLASLGYLYLNQIFRLSTFVILAMIACTIPPSLWQPIAAPNVVLSGNDNSGLDLPLSSQADINDVQIDTSAEGLNRYLTDFFSLQSSLTSSLSSIENITPNYDILFINICSLSWDDLEFSGNIDHPLFEELDIVFNKFNSATSYSGPAVLRILRANCGQQSHAALFDNKLTKQCSLFDELHRLGFEKEVLMNHDGKFDGFNKHIASNIGPFTAAVNVDEMQPSQYAFDGTKIYSDQEVLSKWNSINHDKPTVTLYNTISIHDGNRVIGESGSRLVTYKRQQAKLLDELYAFFQNLTASGRNVVVVLLPEHGAAVRGDRMQISGMREIPTKAITSVPVGVKFFGNATIVEQQQITVDTPVSFLAISDLIANIASSGIYQGESVTLNSLIENLPQTPVVSQNQGTTMLEVDGKQFYSFDETSWTEYKQ